MVVRLRPSDWGGCSGYERVVLQSGPQAHPEPVIKRIVAACCWFVVITWAYNYLGFFLWPDPACTVRDEPPMQTAESTVAVSATQSPWPTR